MYSVTRYHDFSAGHRVAGHEGKCAEIHGHNYRVHFTCEPEDGLDDVGRVVDFSFMKDMLCQWLENHWDHKTLIWTDDPEVEDYMHLKGVRLVSFNPTAENMARHLVEVVGPAVLQETGVVLRSVRVDETRKCSATYTRED